MERRITVSLKQLLFFVTGIVVATSILVSSFTRFLEKSDPVATSTVSLPTAAPQTQVLGATPDPTGTTDEVLVTKVIDGDTIEIEGADGSAQRIRYIGIDTPETVDPRTTVQCFGKNASDKNRELVEGKRVRLEKDVSETDRYGRLLRYVYLGEIMVNEALVRDGFAISSSYPPDIKYQEIFNARQTEARTQQKGLWSACSTPSPSANTTQTTTTGQTLGTNTTNNVNSSSPQVARGDCDIKGNITSEKIYHVPGGQFYEKTVIDESKGEKWFCTEEEAVAAGWRKSKV